MDKNVIVIGTYHETTGNCNASCLLRIVERIQPEVIFEELPRSSFEWAYSTAYSDANLNGVPPEIKCIIEYSSRRKIQHFPVDIEPRDDLKKEQIDLMFCEFGKSLDYRVLSNMQDAFIRTDGFDFLNSQVMLGISRKKIDLEKRLLNFPNYRAHFYTYKKFKEEQQSRELAMLANINDFSSKNTFDTAVFFIGAAHLAAIRRKVNEIQKAGNSTIRWAFYSPGFWYELKHLFR